MNGPRGRGFVHHDQCHHGDIIMTNVQRRDVLIGSAVAAAAVAAAKPAAAGDPSFMNNVPDPLISGDDLPTFKFALEKSEGKVIGGSYGKEATVQQLPISKGIAGVSMRLEPGAMRELHWHATAAEWAFVIEGRVRTTVIDPQGRAETNEFEPGDVWYFPRGHGHMLHVWVASPATLFSFSTTGTFPSSAPSASQTGSATRRRLSWPRTSACPRRRSTRFRRRRSILPAGQSLRHSRPRRCKAGICRRRRTNTVCSPKNHTRYTRAAGSGALMPVGSRSR